MADVIPSAVAASGDGATRKEKRKAMKKLKRKQTRKEAAVKQREEEEARRDDPEEQLRIQIREQNEAEAAEMERRAFEERERLWLEAAAARKAAEEAEAAAEEGRKKLLLEEEKKHKERADDPEENDDWEYVEEGPAEIIWQGNEIIVKKKRVKITKESAKVKPVREDCDRPTSNPLPPQSSAFASYVNEPSSSAQEALEKVAQQVPNFGTEQDKAHCPFHLKTGACRFGSRCSRIHFHPDKSCTLLIKNMYNGPGLAWEQDEGLEICTRNLKRSWTETQDLCLDCAGELHYPLDDEVERSYEEFYEDVHTEFLKYGELVNFKVCRNGSYHLRGNVYVHYKSLDSAVLAYNSINGRYYAGKQIICEFISVTKWKVAICGEFMKSRFKTCSHGSACNFIHCFHNPGGDYEWADWDNPPPKYWIKKMITLFGHSDQSDYDRLVAEDSERSDRKRIMTSNRFHSRLENGTDSHSRQSRGADPHVRDVHFCHHTNTGHHSTRKRKEVPSEQSNRKSKIDDNLKIRDSTYDEPHSENEHTFNKHGRHKGRDTSEDGSYKRKREMLDSKKYMEDGQYELRHSRQHRQESQEPYRHSKSYDEPHRENEEKKSHKRRKHKGRHRSDEDSYKRKREEPLSKKYTEDDDQYEARYNDQHPTRHSRSDDNKMTCRHSSKHSLEKSKCKLITDQERHGEGCCYDDLDSNLDLCGTSSLRGSSRYHLNHESDDIERKESDCRVREKESGYHRGSSQDLIQDQRSPSCDLEWERVNDCSRHRGSSQSHEEHGSSRRRKSRQKVQHKETI